MAKLGDFYATRNRFYEYNGIMMSSFMMPLEAVEAAKTTRFYSEDTIIISYPKTGTTWTEEITWLVTHDCDTYTAKRIPREERSTFLEAFHPDKSSPEALLIAPSPPRLIKTHLHSNLIGKNVTEGGAKAIVITRDVRDVLVSYFNHAKNIKVDAFQGTWDDYFELFKNKGLAYGDWYDFYKGWMGYMGDPNFMFLKYEDLKANPEKEIRKVAKHLKRELTDGQIETILEHTRFDNMKNNAMAGHRVVANFYRKGGSGDWKNYFSESQTQYIEEYLKDRVLW